MKISLKTLDKYCACLSQRAVFKRLFGAKGGTVTKARCLKAAQHLDFDWAAAHLLSGEAEAVYYKALRKDRFKFNAAWARVVKRVDDAYAKFGERDYAKWDAVRDAAVDEKTILRSAYNKARALAFWKAATSKHQGEEA